MSKLIIKEVAGLTFKVVVAGDKATVYRLNSEPLGDCFEVYGEQSDQAILKAYESIKTIKESE